MDYSKLPVKWSRKKNCLVNKQTGRPIALQKAIQAVYELGYLNVSPKELEENLRELAESEPQAEVSGQLKYIREQFGIPQNITDFIRTCYERNQITVSMAGNLNHPSGVDPDVSCKGDLIDYTDLVRALPKEEKTMFPIWGMRELTVGMEKYNLSVSALKRATFAKEIEFKKYAKPYEFRKLVEVLTGDPTLETKEAKLTSTVLKHVLWQIKRKLIGQPVEQHMMILISGPQGSGKTTLLRKLAAPFEDLYIEPNVDELVSKFSSQIVERYRIANIEEWSHDERVNASALKKLLTAEKRTERQMFSMSTRSVSQNLTLFATSNQDLKRVIYDPTGMRRFYEINLDWLNRTATKHLDFEAINEIDFLKVWKFIDETSGAPILQDTEVYVQLQEVQETYRSKSAAENFIMHYNAWPIEKGEKANTNFYPVREIYELYITQYSRGIGRCLKTVSLNAFASQLRELDIEVMEYFEPHFRLKRFNIDRDDDMDELEAGAISPRKLKELIKKQESKPEIDFDDTLL